MAVLVSDSFNRVNDATTMGSTDSYNGGTSKTWTPRSGSVWGICNNLPYAVSGSNPFYTTVDAGASDVSIMITLPVYQDEFVCMFRVNTTSNTGLLFNATGRKLKSFNGSTFTTIAATSGNLTNGTTIKIVAQGSSITVYENGTQIITATSTINQTSTFHGLGNWRYSGPSSTNTSWDNFIIEDLSGSGTTGSTAFDTKQSLYLTSSTLYDTIQKLYTTGLLTYDTKQSLYALGTWNADTRQLYQTGTSQADTVQRLYAAGTTNFDTLQVIANTLSTSFDTQQSFYQSGAITADTKQSIYYIGSVNYDTLQLIQNNSITFDTVQRLFQTGQTAYDTRQNVNQSGLFSVDTAQRLYTVGSAVADTVQKLYETRNVIADTSQHFYLVSSRGYDTLVIIGDFQQIISRVELKGRRDLNVQLQGRRDLTIQLKGSL